MLPERNGGTTMKRTLCGIALLVLGAPSANAVLVSRSSGQAYYDDVLDITWLADANYAQTSGYDADGRMTWPLAQDWIASLNTENHLGVDDWRLPTIVYTGTPGCDYGYELTDCGYNADVTTSAMAHLFYDTLGNTAYYNEDGAQTGCSNASPYCLTNRAPFSKLQPYFYWSGTAYAPRADSDSWYFRFAYGSQNHSATTNEYYAWAVRDGDIALVPEPAAALLFPSALAALAWLKRRTGGSTRADASRGETTLGPLLPESATSAEKSRSC